MIAVFAVRQAGRQATKLIKSFGFMKLGKKC